MGLFEKLFGKKRDGVQPSASVSTVEAFQPSHFFVNDRSPETVPLAARIKAAYPSATGLYPHEILALDYAKYFTVSQSEFQAFWLYRYSVDDVQRVLQSLLERGYLTTGGIENTLNKQTVYMNPAPRSRPPPRQWPHGFRRRA